jgi:hypothetical protein
VAVGAGEAVGGLDEYLKFRASALIFREGLKRSFTQVGGPYRWIMQELYHLAQAQAHNMYDFEMVALDDLL